MSGSTWWRGLTARERLVLSSATAAIFVAILAMRLVPVWTSWAATQLVRRAVLSDSLAQMRATMTREARNADRVARQLLDQQMSRTILLTARSDEDTFLPLLKLVSAAADDVGVTVSSVQRVSESAGPISARERSRTGYVTASVKTIGVAHADLLPEFLAFIDTSRVQLSTKSASISAGARGGSSDESVQFEIVISALVDRRVSRKVAAQ